MDDQLTSAQEIARLRAGIDRFIACVRPLAPGVLLRRVTEWAPRDVAAHLIGWNVITLEGCRMLEHGETPAYLAGEEDDFAHVNAVSVARYDARDRDVLLGQLRTTADALLGYLERLDPDDWDRDFGPRGPSGRPATIRNEVAPLAADYLGHAQEIAAWTAAIPPSNVPRDTPV